DAFERFDEDCVIVSQQQSLDDQFHADFPPQRQSDFVGQINPGNRFPPPPPRPLVPAIRVDVVDSEPDHDGQAAFDDPLIDQDLLAHAHGYTMQSIARDIACGPGNACASYAPATHLALPHIDNTTLDTTLGGNYGTPGELAVAIAAAVNQWLTHRAS